MTIKPAQRAPSPEPLDEAGQTTARDLDRYGIITHPMLTYEWNGFRYTNASDAIAAAKRAAR